MCSIYAKLSLRNDGPGDGALLSRRASSVSGRVTPELLFLVRGQRTVKTETDYQEKAKRKKKRKENDNGKASVIGLTGLIFFYA